MSRLLEVAILEPYYGGSHATFVDTLAERSRHRISVVSLPARKWKWRMRGAAIWFTQEDNAWVGGDDARLVQVILANDMLSVADLRAWGGECLPASEPGQERCWQPWPGGGVIVYP